MDSTCLFSIPGMTIHYVEGLYTTLWKKLAVHSCALGLPYRPTLSYAERLLRVKIHIDAYVMDDLVVTLGTDMTPKYKAAVAEVCSYLDKNDPNRSLKALIK